MSGSNIGELIGVADSLGKPLFNPRQRGKNLGAKLRVGRNELKPGGQVEIESCHQIGGCNGLL